MPSLSSQILRRVGVLCKMEPTGADMSDRYKETSKGGLAVNVVAC